MDKYKLLFDFLKRKVGPDPARIIIYEVYCDDLNKCVKRLSTLVWEKIGIIYEKLLTRQYGINCGHNFIYDIFTRRRKLPKFIFISRSNGFEYPSIFY